MVCDSTFQCASPECSGLRHDGVDFGNRVQQTFTDRARGHAADPRGACDGRFVHVYTSACLIPDEASRVLALHQQRTPCPYPSPTPCRRVPGRRSTRRRFGRRCRRSSTSHTPSRPAPHPPCRSAATSKCSDPGAAGMPINWSRGFLPSSDSFTVAGLAASPSPARTRGTGIAWGRAAFARPGAPWRAPSAGRESGSRLPACGGFRRHYSSPEQCSRSRNTVQFPRTLVQLGHSEPADIGYFGGRGWRNRQARHHDRFSGASRCRTC